MLKRQLLRSYSDPTPSASPTKYVEDITGGFDYRNYIMVDQIGILYTP